MLLASVDIGTNAVRLLFATVHHRDGVIGIEKDTLLRIPVRLGKDVYSTGKISSARSRALVQTLKAFQMLMEVHKPESFKACATAAMREAVNGKQILKKIKKETG
ncbi:MAG: Ppx/GppA family phosphatase, partial [Bacteroidales bacterium]|nr:Ppx/GppA family phosphatase [Bacteroidales bacterium]